MIKSNYELNRVVARGNQYRNEEGQNNTVVVAVA